MRMGSGTTTRVDFVMIRCSAASMFGVFDDDCLLSRAKGAVQFKALVDYCIFFFNQMNL